MLSKRPIRDCKIALCDENVFFSRANGTLSNPAANGRRVVIVRTPPDFAARGRINVNLDGAVKAVKRENVVPVPSAGVGRAPSSAAMAWLTPGFLSFVSPGGYRTDETCGIYPWGWS